MIRLTLPMLAAGLGAAFLLAGSTPASAQTGHYTEINSSNTFNLSPSSTKHAQFNFTTDVSFTPTAGGSAVDGTLSFFGRNGQGLTTATGKGGTFTSELFNTSDFSFSADSGQNAAYDIDSALGTAKVTELHNNAGFYVHGVFGSQQFEFQALFPGFDLSTKEQAKPITNGGGNTAPVPEASSMVSFGAMILLGVGALILRRRKAAGVAAA